MKITRYETFIVGTPWRNLTYVLVETDAGFTGVGEARATRQGSQRFIIDERTVIE